MDWRRNAFWSSWLVLAVVAWGATPARVAGEELYALAYEGPFFRVVDRTTGADIATISTVVAGGWRGMAMSPTTGVMYITDTEGLSTIDLTTGATANLGLFGSTLIRDLTMDRNGLLYGVSGAQGSSPHSLHLIDTANANVTALFPLSGGGGHGIAYDPAEPGAIYHLAFSIFESVDLTSGGITPIGLSGDPIPDPPLGLVYDSIDGVFRFFDDQGRYYALARDGTVTATGSQNPTIYFGLAFDQLTTRGSLFADGFESGDTSAWSSTVP
jgi:hypothetical protein